MREGLPDRALKSDYLTWFKSFIYYTAQAAGADADTLAEAEAEVDDLTVSAFANRLGYPRLDGGAADPLLVIANLPVRTIITTSPTTFLEDALRRAGKSPRTELCRWHKELDGIDSAIDATYRPSTREPLVYHLHGLDAYPDSLVLTEDDHLQFLVNVCQDQGNNAADRVHALVRQALFDDLILLGYSLSSWAFRGLYAGMIKTGGRQEDRGVVALQVVPDQNEKAYLDDYVRREARFDVFWGDAGQYITELQGKLQPMTAPEPLAPGENPYVGPRTFRREQSHLFFGREREARDLLARVVSERLLLFYAQSGAGKSSLINARLIPGLQAGGLRRAAHRPGGRRAAGGRTRISDEHLPLQPDAQPRPGRAATLIGSDGLSLSDFLARLTTEDGEHWEYQPCPPPARANATGGCGRRATAFRPHHRPVRGDHHDASRSLAERAEFFRQFDQAHARRSEPLGGADAARGLRRRARPLCRAAGRPPAGALLHGAHGRGRRAGGGARAGKIGRLSLRPGRGRTIGGRPAPGARGRGGRAGPRAVRRAGAVAGGLPRACGSSCRATG